MRLLIITPRVLFPADTGGKIRSANMFRCMAAHAETTLLSYRTQQDTDEMVDQMRALARRAEFVNWHEQPTASALGRLNAAANLLSPDAFAIAKYARREMQQRVRELLSQERYDLIVCDFLQMAKNLPSGDGPSRVLFQHNVEGIIRRRQFEHAGNALWKAYFFWEWRRLARFEARTGQMFDRLIMVSQQDCDEMGRQYGVHNTSAIPLGVDADYFRPPTNRLAAHPPSLVFTGSMDWLPNQDAVRFFVEKIYPLVRRRTDCTFSIVGRNPPPSIVKLARQQPGVEVTGRVDDVRPYLHRASAYVVPLRVGGGTRIKIFEAMAAQCPVVSTHIGAEGLPVAHQENILLADSPEDFASCVISLLEDVQSGERLSLAGRNLVADHYGWDAAARRFLQICSDVVERSGVAATPCDGETA
jgi:polysaccharide biosynthesis protein PslH